MDNITVYYLVKVLSNEYNARESLAIAAGYVSMISSEMGYFVPSYNLSKVKNILGTENSGLVKFIKAAGIKSRF